VALGSRSLTEKITESHNYMHQGGLNEDPNAVIFLLLAEIQSLNGRLVYVLGALSIIIVLLLATLVG
jgi:hypothetical protein